MRPRLILNLRHALSTLGFHMLLFLCGQGGVRAQDTVYTHWPTIQSTDFDPGLKATVGRSVEAILALPVVVKQVPQAKGFDRESSGGQLLVQADQHMKGRDYVSASLTADKALQSARATDDRYLEMHALGLIGSISREVFLGSSLKAVPYHEQALRLAQNLKDTVYIVRQLLALADNYGQAGQNDKCLLYLGAASQILQANNLPNDRMRLGLLYSLFLVSTNDLAKAEQLFLGVMKMARKLNKPDMVQHMHWQFFELYLLLGDEKKAQASLDSISAVDAANSEEGFQEAKYQLEKLRGNRAAAFQHLEKAYRSLGDTYLKRSAEQLAGWETRLRIQEKERQLEEQLRFRRLLSGMIVLVSVLLVFSLIAWFKQRQAKHTLREQNKLIEQQTQELRQLSQQKSRFFANAAHELRTPLTLILGPLEQTLKENRLSKLSTRLLQSAQRNAQQLLGLVNEILDLTKLNIKQPELNLEATVVHEYLEEIIQGFQPLAESRKIKLQLTFAQGPKCTLNLDRKKLLKVLNNLLSNAIKFTPAGGTVTLRAQKQADELTLKVIDTGPGIHPDDLAQIFDLYYQSNHQETKPEGGIGIGLALSRELMKVMNGRLWVESEFGAGSTFSLALPVIERPMESAAPILKMDLAPKAQAVFKATPLARPTVNIAEDQATLLLVEDNTDLQEFLLSFLTRHYRVVLVENGQFALDYLRTAEKVPDLVLSDLMMPVMDGFQLVDTMKKVEQWRTIPIILLTARAERSNRLRAFQIGIDDYLVKPFAPEELLVRIENALRNQASRREWAEALDEIKPQKEQDPKDFWLEQLESNVRENLGDFQLNVDRLAELMGMSRTSLYRHVREATGLSANQYIQEVRLLQARELLESKTHDSLRAVAEAVGFRTTDYLSRLYRDRFGKSPSELL